MRLTQPCHYDNIKITVSDITRLISPPYAPIARTNSHGGKFTSPSASRGYPGAGQSSSPPAAAPSSWAASGAACPPCRDSARNTTCVRKLEAKPCSAQQRGSREPSRAWMGSTPRDVQLFSSGLFIACHLFLTTWKVPQ